MYLYIYIYTYIRDPVKDPRIDQSKINKKERNQKSKRIRRELCVRPWTSRCQFQHPSLIRLPASAGCIGICTYIYIYTYIHGSSRSGPNQSSHSPQSKSERSELILCKDAARTLQTSRKQAGDSKLCRWDMLNSAQKTWFNTIWYNTIWYNTISYNIILYYIVLYYIILYYIILYCIISYCIILYYII